MIRRLYLLSALLLATPWTAIADDAPKALSVSSEVGIFSHYMFRGFKLYNGPTIQPSVNAAYDTGAGTVSGNLWMHLTGDSDNTAERFTELDETIEYSNTIGGASIAIGNSWYTYSDLGDGSNIEDLAEVYATVAFDAPLTPTVSIYHDWRTTHAQYYELALSHDLENILGEGGTLTPFVAFGFASNAEDVYVDDGLVQISTGVSTTIPLGAVSVVPSFNYSFKVDDNTINQFWFGTTFSYSFS